jgi:hypothetical protein
VEECLRRRVWAKTRVLVDNLAQINRDFHGVTSHGRVGIAREQDRTD